MPSSLSVACVAILAGGSKPSQDRIFTTANAAILLDGATSAHARRYDGGWFADRLGRAIADRLTRAPNADLAAAATEAVAIVNRSVDLRIDKPSSTLAVARWTMDALDVLVLGDSPVVVYHPIGATTVVSDQRLQRVAREQRVRYLAGLTGGGGFGAEHRQVLQRLRTIEESVRNTPHGYWIAGSVPEAVQHAIQCRWALSEVDAVLLASDGVSAGISKYRQPKDWAQVRSLIERDGAAALLRQIHDLESTDPDGQRWPRSKRHDDKAVVLIAGAEKV
nr:protein phosphatase 2C domain-containing protein [Micromonospora sp. DSM 115978]